MSILVVGGAGYIGSHTVRYLQEQNEKVIVVDNLQNGHREAVHVESFYEIDIRDTKRLDEVFKKHSIDAVIHFGANSLVGESMDKPLEYYDNNVYGMQCLLEVMKNNDVKKIVFSSSAATYGEPDEIPIIETNKKILLGVASVWSDKKGLNIFFELAELISSKYVIVLVGLNKKQLNSLPENIIGIKRTNSINDLVNLYSSAHIFINPTFADNYPTVNLEAQACGTPVITFDTGGSAETILENMGIITNKKDVDSVLKAIETVEDNYHNLKSFNKTDISKETFTRNMLEFYTKN